MQPREKRVIYESTNTYSTLNTRTRETEHIWFVFHGLGFLSRFFLPYFKGLDPQKNYIVAPQAPSKYYQEDDFKYVGASWLTKENTLEETQNVLRYVDAVYQNEEIPASKKQIFFGFSQGVSICLRWLVAHRIKPDLLVLYAGGIPKELTPPDCAFLKGVRILFIYGDQDPYITANRIEEEKKRAQALFAVAEFEIHKFNGKHVVKPEVIEKLSDLL